MVTNIRKGKASDLPQVLELIKELALYEKAPSEVTVTLTELIEDSFGDKPVFYFFVAEQGSEILGTAIYYIKYSTWKGRCVYLEDIIVKESQRGKNIGTNLFKAVLLESKNLGAKRMEWQVLDWNTPALHFYEKFDALVDPSWVNCKLTEEQILNYKF
ncbi:MAG TPA: GNAT family N-acetyltransferase [Bacteroidia bacterium]|nr:GNAT family N-acetyltransferase [Bacteroidia bacterium]HRH07239.1 GNAT family N-acetyltransferase [Bacteroidia bacterium]